MPSDTTLDLVRVNLLNALGALDAPPSFSALLKIPLTQPDKVLGGADRPHWVQLVMAACTATSGDVAIGAQVAAAVEVFMAALDLLDEIEDGDVSPTVDAAGSPQALNVSTALLLLSQRMLLALPLRAGLPSPVEFVRTLTDGGLTATGGQHRDLASVNFANDSPEDVLATARLKAGALSSAACRLGAMVGTADENLLELYSRWGTHFGTVAQLANDLHDALDTTEKSDVARRKSTMPLIFSHRAATDSGEDRDIPQSGALHFTWVVVEMERQACRELTAQLEAQGQHVVTFRQLVS